MYFLIGAVVVYLLGIYLFGSESPAKPSKEPGLTLAERQERWRVARREKEQ